MRTITICGDGPHRVVKREDAGVRWCFGCRKHLEHEHRLMDVAERVVTYYDPYWIIVCSRCGKDRTHFPGQI